MVSASDVNGDFAAMLQAVGGNEIGDGKKPLVFGEHSMPPSSQWQEKESRGGGNEEEMEGLREDMIQLLMDICRGIVEIWINMSIGYHKKHLLDVPSLGFQFHNDCSFLAHHLTHLSVRTNHGRKEGTDVKSKHFIWFMDFVRPLNALGQKYLIHHLVRSLSFSLSLLSFFRMDVAMREK